MRPHHDEEFIKLPENLIDPQTKRCPKCRKNSLQYDINNTRLACPCGYEAYLKS